MKALPLWQPWASLVAAGAKRVETRHWPTPPALIGQRVAIHATKTRDHLHVVATEPFRGRLRDAQLAGELALIDGELPLGAIVATAVIDRCRAITPDGAAKLLASDPDEHAFGNYSLVGGQRYAWVLRHIDALAMPVAFSGARGIFEVPDDLLGHEPAQGALL